MSLSREWRKSRLAALASRIPGLRDLPMQVLEASMGRLQRVRQSAIEQRFRVAAWLRTVRAWRERGPVRGWPGAIRRGLRFGLLQRFFLPEVMQIRLAPTRVSLPARIEDSIATIAGSAREGPNDRRLNAIVYTSTTGNFFHAEMAELLALALEQSGLFLVNRQDERAEPGTADLHLVAAPHEFFALGAGARFARPEHRAFRRRCTLFMAEQPGTTHFVSCLPFAADAARVLDLNAASAGELRRLGFDADFFPVGYVQAADSALATPPVPAATAVRGLSLAAAASAEESRPIDVLFLGVLTRRRAEFFSRHAEFFASRRCLMSLPTRFTPLRQGVASTLDRAEATALSARSKILLNVHRDERPYFEWHRIVIRGLWQKTLVVSEPSQLPPGFVAGRHLMEAPLAEIPELLRWLLESEDGRRKANEVREAGHRLLTEQYDMRRWVRALAASLSS